MSCHLEKWKDPVSIVIPAYNEQSRILSSLKTLAHFCQARFERYEIICVDDGSSDATWELITSLDGIPALKPLRLAQNRGKGYAVRYGMLAARGRFRFFTDADLPYELSAFTAAMHSFYSDRCDLVTGDRRLPASSDGRQVGGLRKLAGTIFSALATRLVKMDVHDSQCGFKGFTEASARQIFTRLQTSGYAFDVEVFALARAFGLNVCRIPVTLVKQAGSKIRLSRDPFLMMADLIRLAGRTASAKGVTAGVREPAAGDQKPEG